MSRQPFQVGIVGAGHISPFHVQAIQRVPDARVVAVFDRDVRQAQQLAAAYEIPHCCASYAELLDRCHVVHVLTPPAHHAELTITALQSGCDVFVEKPLATSVDDCDRIMAAMRAADRTVGVDHSLLLDPFTVRAQRLIERGAIGRVLSVECLRNQDAPEYGLGPLPREGRQGGDPFRDLGIHGLYQMEALLGPIQDVQSQFLREGLDPVVYYDEWRVTVRCQRGTGNLRISWNARPVQDMIIIQGTQGSLKIDRFGMNVVQLRQLRLPEHPQRVCNALSEAAQIATQVPLNLCRVATGRIRRYHGLQAMVGEFYDRLRAGRPPRVDGVAARRIAHWLEHVAGDADRRKQQELARYAGPYQAKILVTGGTGFIGRYLVERLLSAGQRLRLFCRRPPTETWAQQDGLEIIVGDLGDAEAVDRAVRGVECVYHLGGTVHGSAAEFWRGSVQGTEHIVNSVLAHRVPQLIYVSSLSVLAANFNEDGVLRETSPLESLPDQRGLYTQTKLAAELLVTRAVHERRLPAVIVRPGEVIDDGAPRLSSGIGQRLASQLLILGDGQLVVPMVHVQDLVSALLTCEQRKIVDGSIFHLVDPRPLTQDQLACQYSTRTGQRLRVWHVPASAVFAVARAVEVLSDWCGRTTPVTQYRFKSALARRRFDISLAQHKLAWQPCYGVDSSELVDTSRDSCPRPVVAGAPRSSR